MALQLPAILRTICLFVSTMETSPPRNVPHDRASIARKLVRSAALALLGFAAVAIPLHLLLRRELLDAPEEVRSQGWPIRLLQVIFAKFIIQWIDVEGLENLPPGSYLVAANHGYKSGVDGFVLGHLLADQARPGGVRSKVRQTARVPSSGAAQHYPDPDIVASLIANFAR